MLAFVVCGSCVLATASAARDDPTPDPGQSVPYTPDQQRAFRIQDAIEFRQDVGFRSDQDYVASMDDRRWTYPDAVTKYGLPLTDTEMRQLADRDRIAEAADAIEEDAAKMAPDTFAGVYIGGDGSGVLKVGFTKSDAERDNALGAGFPYPKQFEIVKAEHSMDDLEAYKQAIAKDLWSLNTEFGVVEVGVDPSSNSLVVGAENPTDDLLAELRKRYPEAPLQLTQTTMPTLEDYDSEPVPPMQAGLLIFANTGLGTVQCSAAFSAKKFGTDNYFQLTAGHCGKDGDVWFHQDLFGPDYRVGPGEANAFYGSDDSPVDAQRLDLADADRSNLVFEPNGNQQHIHHVDNTPTDGETECISAWGGAHYLGDGKRCGEVKQPVDVIDVVNPYNGNHMLLFHVAKLDIRSCLGDSGGPVYHNDSAEGILSATDIQSGNNCGRPTWSQNLGTAENRLNVNVFAPGS